MRVRTLAAITTPQGTIPPGKTLTIPDAALGRLRGKVEIIPAMSTDEAVKKIGAVIEDLDCSNSWPDDLWVIISPEAQARVQDANRAVDHAADELKDSEALDVALIEYRLAWLLALHEVSPPAP